VVAIAKSPVVMTEESLVGTTMEKICGPVANYVDTELASLLYRSKPSPPRKYRSHFRRLDRAEKIERHTTSAVK